MKVDDLLRIYFSLGALAPDAMQKSLKNPRLPATPASVAPPKARDERKLIVSQDAAE
jgi:hypothetical protein